MLSSWNRLRATVPGPFLAALGLTGGFMAFVAWDQSYWWRIKQDYSFGWLVPLFVAFTVYDRWDRIEAQLKACGAPGSPRAVGWQKGLLALLVGAVLAIGAVFFVLGAFYRAGAGASQPGSVALTGGMMGIAFALLLLNAPDSPAARPASLWRDARVRLVALFTFPLLIWMVSAPLVSAMENELNLLLLRGVVAVVAFVFETLGLPIEQHGNVLTLPTGNVGVEDACSGIRSLTGCLFAGAFLAAVFLEDAWRKFLLVTAALALAFLTNLGRSLFLTGWAYRHGPASIEGTVHDVAGYAVLGLTVVGLLCLLPVLNLRLESAAEPEAGSASPQTGSSAPDRAGVSPAGKSPPA